MERILVLLVLVVSVTAFRPNPKFPKEDTDIMKKVSCGAHEDRRNEIISRSKCGEPKEVFVELKPQTFMKMVPSAVWVRRCVGLCDHGPAGSRCIALNRTIEHIPVRIHDLKSPHKETCVTYPVEVHLSCGCGCEVATKECPSPRIFNPRKCNCQCPNMKERRNCLKQRNPAMRWNPSKCICERRRR